MSFKGTSVKPTCCVKRRSSTGTAAFSCHQEQRSRVEDHIWSSLWRTGRSGTTSRRQTVFRAVPCVLLVFGSYLVQLQHGLGLLAAPHVSHQELSDSAQVRSPGLLRGHGSSSEQNSSAVQGEAVYVPSGPSAKTSGSRRGKSDRVPAGRRSCQQHEEEGGRRAKHHYHQQQPKGSSRHFKLCNFPG